MVETDLHVLQRRHLAEQLDVLECTCNAGECDVRRRAAHHGIAVKRDAARRRHVDAGQHVHHGALARAVGTDQAVDRAALDAQVHHVQRLEAAELHQYPLGHQHIASVTACGGLAECIKLGVESGIGIGGSGLAEQQVTEEAHDAVLQVIHHEQNHEAKNAQTPVGDGSEPERKASQSRSAENGNRHGAWRCNLLADSDYSANSHQHRQGGCDRAEQRQIVQQFGQDHDDGCAKE